MVWAIWLIGVFYLFTLVLGYGATALLPPGTITAANQNNAAPLLAYALGGELLLGADLGGRVRHDPGRRRRADDHRVGLVRPRRLRQRDPPRERVAAGARCGSPG